MGNKITILMPAYNHARFIAQAIDSVLSQTYTDWELIIVNDGSTDDTAQVIANYTDARITYYDQLNQGCPAALNKGFVTARGDFVLILASDDWLLPDSLSVLHNAFSIYEDAGVIYSDGYVVTNNGEQMASLSSYRQAGYDDTLSSIINISPVVGVHSAMIRASLLAQLDGPFDTAMLGYEDWDLFIRLKAMGACFQEIPNTTCCYRFHGQNKSAPKSTLSTKRRKALIHNRLKVLNAPWFETLTVEARARFFREFLAGAAVGDYGVQRQVISHPAFLLLQPTARADVVYYMSVENLLQAPNLKENGRALWQAIRWSPRNIRLYALVPLLFVGDKARQKIIMTWRRARQDQTESVDPVTQILRDHHVA